MNSSENMKVTRLEPLVEERKLWDNNFLLTGIIFGVIVILIEFFSLLILDLDLVAALILALVLVVIYAAILYFLLEPRILREVRMKEIQHIEQPVIKQVEVPKPVIKEVIVEKPVYRDVIKEVPKPVYFEKTRKKLNIPKYDYIGSDLTKIYHKRSCRLGKSIKRKYKLSSNLPSYFKRRGFKACEACIKKTAKV